MSEVSVQVQKFTDLFDTEYKIVIPDYQRPYTWTVPKTEELINDFKEHFITRDSKLNYYMGAILFFKNEEEKKLEVIDGQQRLTTLLILYWALNGELPRHLDLDITAHLSVSNITKCKGYLLSIADTLKAELGDSFLQRLSFTTIVTPTEDDAFTFFDTQNNRGVKLGSSDFLKAYHLRAIRKESESLDHIQRDEAKTWENQQSLDETNTFLESFIGNTLWRVRNWKGKNRKFENKDRILYTFQKQTITAADALTYPLFKGKANMAFGSAEHINDRVCFVKNTDEEKALHQMPFSIRQPLYKGLNFFHYTKKYVEVYSLLFKDVTEDKELLDTRVYYNALYVQTGMSAYLREFMQLLLITYYDNFGTPDLVKAIKLFDLILGSIRLKKRMVMKEAIPKLLRESSENLLDLLVGAYHITEIEEYLRVNTGFVEVYQEIKAEKVPDIKGVQGKYLKGLLTFYGKEEQDLKHRRNW
jgi:hypothetical protein